MTTTAFTGFKSGLGFDFSQVTGMRGTFHAASLRQPDLLYPSGSFSGVTEMAHCWKNSCPNSTFPFGGVDATGGPFAYPVMDLSSVTGIGSGFANLFTYDTRWDRTFLNHLNLSNVSGPGLEGTFQKAFEVGDTYFDSSDYQRFTMPNLGLNVANGITSLQYYFSENTQVTGIPWMNTSNVTNWKGAFYHTFNGFHAGSSSVAPGAPLNIESDVTGLIFPAFDVSAGTGFFNTFNNSNKALGFMSRDFSSAVDLGYAFNMFGYNAPLTSHCEWGMPDTPSGHFPTILVPSARNFFYTWNKNRWFDVFPEIDFSSAWSINSAWWDADIREFKSWNFASIDQSDEWKTYDSTVDHTLAAGADNAFMNCGSLSGFTNGLHFGNPTGLSQTFYACASLLEMPDLTSRGGSLSQVQSYAGTFVNCVKIPEIPFAIDVSSALDMQKTFFGCSLLRSCPEFIGTTSKVRTTSQMFAGCGISGSIPRRGSTQLDTSSSMNLYQMFWGCQEILDIGDIDCSSVEPLFNIGLIQFAYNAAKLTGLNLHSTASVNRLEDAFWGCLDLVDLATGGAALDFTSVTHADRFMFGTASYDTTAIPAMTFKTNGSFYAAWAGMGNATKRLIQNGGPAWTWPSMDYGTGLYGLKTFAQAWQSSPAMTTFNAPLNDSFACTGESRRRPGIGDFFGTWEWCTGLVNFPANVFDNCAVTGFNYAWYATSLSSVSIENILTSIDTAGESNGVIGMDHGTVSFGSASHSTWTSPALTALSNLSGKGWTVLYNP